MNIAVKGDINVIVTKNFTEGFHVHTSFNTSCSECMPQSMIMDILQITGFCTFLKVITQKPRLYVCFIASQEKTAVRYIKIVHLTDTKNCLWNGDISDGTFAFRFSYHDLCTGGCGINSQSLHRT